MSKVMIVVTFEVKPEHRARFLDTMRGHAQRTLANEAGCLQFEVLEPADKNDRRVLLFEAYANAAALEAHNAGPGLAKVRETYKDWINGREITICRPA